MSLFDRLLGAIRLGDDELDDDDYDEDDELDEEDDEDEDFEEDKPNKLFNMKFRKKSRDTEYDEEDEEDSDEEDDEEEEEEKPRRSFFSFGSRKKKASRDEEEDDEEDEDDEEEDDEEEEEAPRSRRSSERKSSRSRERRSQPRRDTSARQSQSGYTSAQSAYTSSGSYSSTAYSSAGTTAGRTGYRSQSDEIDWSSFVTQKPGVKPRTHKKRNTGARVRVEVIVPKSMEDTQDIAELLMSDAAVILNLEFIDVDTARRIVDFSCGACYALDGGVQQVSNYVYILTPVNVEVSGDFTSMFSNFFDFTSKRSVY